MLQACWARCVQNQARFFIRIWGSGGEDKLYGGGGADVLKGGADDDYVLGGDGADTVYGDLGDDLLRGGDGDDVIYGGDGDDRFRFYRHKENDVIKDFENNIDTVELAGFDDLFETWGELQQYATDTGDDIVFDFGGNDTLTIENVNLGALENDISFL